MVGIITFALAKTVLAFAAGFVAFGVINWIREACVTIHKMAVDIFSKTR